MKLFKFVLICGAIVMPITASAASHITSKQLNNSDLFDVSSNTVEIKNLENSVGNLDTDFLIESSNTFAKESSTRADQIIPLSESFQLDTQSAFSSSGVKSALDSHVSADDNNYDNFSHGNGNHVFENRHDGDEHVTTPVPESKTFELMLAGLLLIGMVKLKTS